MLGARYITIVLPMIVGGIFLWYKRRKIGKRRMVRDVDDDDAAVLDGGVDREMPEATPTATPETEKTQIIDETDVDLGSTLICVSVKTSPEVAEPDVAALDVATSADNERDDKKDDIVDDDRIKVDYDSDAELESLSSVPVADWAEEDVNISKEDLDEDLKTMLKKSLTLSDESPNTRLNRIRKASPRSGSSDAGSDHDWRHRSGDDLGCRRLPPDSLAATPTKNDAISQSPWSSVHNTPERRTPNRRLLRGIDSDPVSSPTTTGSERACPVISCVDSTPSSMRRNASDCDNWRENMAQWDALGPRSIHNSPSDRCSTTSGDSGRGGSEGVPSISGLPGEIVVYEFEFPSELCGRLIGRGGKNLHFMMHETMTRIMLRKQPFDETHQVVSVTGRQEDVQSVLQFVRSKFPKQRHPEVDLGPVQLPLPPELVAPDLLPLYLPEGVQEDVIVSAVVTAGQLFLQMPNHRTFPNLPRLDACMLSCYSQHGAPPLPLPTKPDIICAAPQSGGWYRAALVELLPAEDPYDDEVGGHEFDATIRYVDYGGYSQIPISSLRQIRSDFVSLPFQAVECYLANVCPPDNSYVFAPEGAYFLERLVKGSSLRAEVVTYAEDGIPFVNLYRIEGEEQTLINSELAEAGVVKWIEDFHEYYTVSEVEALEAPSEGFDGWLESATETQEVVEDRFSGSTTMEATATTEMVEATRTATSEGATTSDQ